MQEAIRLGRFRSANFYISNLCPFPQIDMEDHIGQHADFVELRLWLDLSLEVARRDKEIDEISSGLRNDVLFVRGLIGNVDDLQKPSVRKALGCAREVNDSEVKRRLQCAGHMQSIGVWLNVDFNLAEAAGSPQG